MAVASTPPVIEGQPPDPNVLPDAAILEQWMMSAAKESDRSASFLRRMLQMNPGYGRYLSKDQELCGIVELFAKRFRHVVVGSPSPLQHGSLFKPCCELVWRVIGLVLSSITESSDSNVPVSKDAKGQFKMLLQTNLELSEKLKESRRAYLRELSEHRDKQRKLSESVRRTVANLHEHPIMFYEPLEFVLDEATKEFVRNVVEERVKLELRTGFSEDVVNAEVSQHMEELEEKIEGMSADIRRLTNSSMRDEQRAIAAEEKLELVRQECERWKSSVKEKEAEAEDLNSKLDAMEDTLGQRCRQIADLEDQSKRLQSADAKGAFDEVRSQLDAQLDETKALQEKLEQLEQANHAKSMELAAANAQVETMTSLSRLDGDCKTGSAEKVEVVEKIVYFEDTAIREQLDKRNLEVQELRDAKAVLENELEEERQHVWQLSESVELLVQEKEVLLEETAKRKQLESERGASSNSDNVVQNLSDEDIQKAVQEVSMRHEQVTKEQQATIDRLLVELETAHQTAKEAEEKVNEMRREPRGGEEEPESLKTKWKAKYQELSGQHEELQSKYAQLQQELAMVVEKLKEFASAEEMEDTLKKIRTSVSEILCVSPKKPAYLRLHEDAQRRIAKRNESEEAILRVEKDHAQALVSATQCISDSKSLVEVNKLWQRAAAVSKLNRVAAAMSGQFTKAVTNFQEVKRQSLQCASPQVLQEVKRHSLQEVMSAQLRQAVDAQGMDHTANLEGGSPQSATRARWQQSKSRIIDGRGIDYNPNLQPDSPSAVMPAQLRQAMGALGMDHPANLEGGSPKPTLLARFRQAKSRTMDSCAMDNNAILQGGLTHEVMPAQLQQGVRQTTDGSAMLEAQQKAMQPAAAQQFISQQVAARQDAAQQGDLSAQQARLPPDQQAAVAQMVAQAVAVEQAGLAAQQAGHSPEQQPAAEQKAAQQAAEQQAAGQQARLAAQQAGLPIEQQLARQQMAVQQVISQQVTTQPEGGSIGTIQQGNCQNLDGHATHSTAQQKAILLVAAQGVAPQGVAAQQAAARQAELSAEQAGLPPDQQIVAAQKAAQKVAVEQAGLAARQAGLSLKQQAAAEQNAAQQVAEQQAAGQQARLASQQAGLPIKQQVAAQQMAEQQVVAQQMTTQTEGRSSVKFEQDKCQNMDSHAMPSAAQQSAKQEAAARQLALQQVAAQQAAAQQAGLSPEQQAAAEQKATQQASEQQAAIQQATLTAQQAWLPLEKQLNAQGIAAQQVVMQQVTTQTEGGSGGDIQQVNRQNMNSHCMEEITSPDACPKEGLPTYSRDEQSLMDAGYSLGTAVACAVSHEGDSATTNMSALASRALAQDGSCTSVSHRGSLGHAFRHSQSLHSKVASGEAASMLASSKGVSPSAPSVPGAQPLLPFIGATPSASSSLHRTSALVRPPLVLPQLGAAMNDSSGLTRKNALASSHSMSSQVCGLSSSSPILMAAQSCPMGKLHPVLQRFCPKEPEASLQVQRIAVAAPDWQGSSAHHQKQAQGALGQQWQGSRTNLHNQAQGPNHVELFEQALEAAERAGVKLPDSLGHGLCISSLAADLDGTQGGCDSLAALAMSLSAFGMPANGSSSQATSRDLTGLDVAGYALGPSSSLGTLSPVGGGFPPRPRFNSGDSTIDKAIHTMDRFSQISEPSRSGLFATVPQSLPGAVEEIWQRPPPPNLSIGFNPACPSQKPLRPGGQATSPSLAGANVRDSSSPTWSSSVHSGAVQLPKTVCLKSARSAPDLTLTGVRKDSISDGPPGDSPNKKNRPRKKDRGEAANAGMGATKVRQSL